MNVKISKLINRRILLLFVIILVVISGFWYLVSRDRYEHKVDTVMAGLMRDHQIPGAAVAIINNDKTYLYVFGVADKSSGIPVTIDTIFETGSITKLFTAMAAECVSDGKHGLNEPIVKFYQALKWNQYFGKITEEKLLTYTSGLPFNLPENITTAEQAAGYFSMWRPEKEIGSQWQYSNVGIGLEGLVLQSETNEPINQLYQEKILSPLRMSPLGIVVSRQFEPYYASGYAENGEAVPHVRSSGLFPAAVDIKASIKDLSRFLAAAVESGKVPGKLREAMQDMETPRLSVNEMLQGLVWQIHSLDDQKLLDEPENMDMGPLTVKWLPKEKQIFDGNKLIDKTGATKGFRAYMAVIPAKKSGIVVLLNKYVSNGAIVNAGRQILLGTL